MTKNQLAELRNRAIGFIFQFHYLLPEFTALENVLMPYRISKQPIAQETVAQSQRTAWIWSAWVKSRTISPSIFPAGNNNASRSPEASMNNPSIILADEPTGNLDSDSTEQVYELLREINRKFNTTFIIITHDRHIAEKADRIVEIKDGRIHLDISPAI
ncbi:MAG: ABC transporter ATP-binding protein [Bacillus subtilis]|nr:ABC transporter ATP-binding protein [Bacillus subtilis]